MRLHVVALLRAVQTLLFAVAGRSGAGTEAVSEIAVLAQKVDKLAEAIRRQRLANLLIRPTSACTSSVITASSDTDRERIQLKREALIYYGLDIDLSGTEPLEWKVRTMASGDEEVVFRHCTLAHIWPRAMEQQADEVAVELQLPDEFYFSPRNYLLLPQPLEVAFNKMAVLLVPSSDGNITVRKWRSDRVSREEEQGLRKYYGTVLSWPNRERTGHSPHVPFMRLMAYKALSAFAFGQPPVLPDDMPQGWERDMLNASQDLDSHEPLRKVIQDAMPSVIARLNLV